MRGVLSSLIASVVSGEASEAVGRARRAVVLYALAGLLVLCGAGFLLGAAFVTVANDIGTVPAALWFGGGFIVLALLLVVGHKIAANASARRAEKRRQAEMAAVASAAAFAILPALLSSRQGRSAFLVAPLLAALGYAVWRENAPDRKPGNDDPAA